MGATRLLTWSSARLVPKHFDKTHKGNIYIRKISYNIWKMSHRIPGLIVDLCQFLQILLQVLLHILAKFPRFLLAGNFSIHLEIIFQNFICMSSIFDMSISESIFDMSIFVWI